MARVDEFLKARRGNLTQVAFAEKLGISQSNLSALLLGREVPGLHPTARALLRVYPELGPILVPEAHQVVTS